MLKCLLSLNAIITTSDIVEIDRLMDVVVVMLASSKPKHITVRF